MPALFEAYVTNLGKYNEGELVGEYLKFPTTPEEVQALLKRIGVDGVRYEEIFITDFDGDVLGLYDHLGEYENLDELNYLACLLSELDQNDLEKFEAVIDSGEHTSSGNVKKCAVGKYPKSEKLGGAGQAAVCACAHSRYFTGGSPSGLRV